MTDPTPPPRTLPERPILVVTLIDSARGLRFRHEWKVAAPTAKQRYESAVALEKIARHLSPKFKQISDRVDKAAVLGFKMEDLPSTIQKVLERWFSRER